MRHLDLRAAAAAVGVLTILACSEKKPAPEPTYPTAPAPSAEAPPRQAPPPSTPEPVDAAPTQAPPAPAEAASAEPKPAPEAKPAPTAAPAPAPAVKPAPAPAAAPAPAPKPAPAPAAPEAAAPAPVPAPAPAPAPAAAAATHAKVGAQKCKMCHRVQHESWAASPHAKNDLDCEGCHGNGGDYWPATVMRDRARAVANGLVLPTLATCKKCHADADAALFARVHAHKAR